MVVGSPFPPHSGSAMPHGECPLAPSALPCKGENECHPAAPLLGGGQHTAQSPDLPRRGWFFSDADGEMCIHVLGKGCI